MKSLLTNRGIILIPEEDVKHVPIKKPKEKPDCVYRWRHQVTGEYLGKGRTFNMKNHATNALSAAVRDADRDQYELVRFDLVEYDPIRDIVPEEPQFVLPT